MTIGPHLLGRRYAPDPRDRSFMLARPASARTSRFWWGYGPGHLLNQGDTPECVAYAWSHFLIDSPTPHPLDLPPDVLYGEAQALDGLPDSEGGTTVRAGAQALQARARIPAYAWAFDIDTIVAQILEVGPVVVGTDWYDGMFTVGPDRFVRIAGAIAGGHAYKLDGVNVLHRFFRLKNSWGPDWGYGGFARISFDDFARLLADKGEACRAVELPAR